MKPPQNVSEAVRRLNPHIYGNGQSSNNALGGLCDPKPQPDEVRALDQKPQKGNRSKRGVVVCVTIISCRRQLLDDDNSQAAAKAIRDSIARSIGVDDADRRVRWQYGQCETKGKQGTIVNIETV